MLYELNVALVAFSTNDLLVSEVVATTRAALLGLFRLRGALQHPHSKIVRMWESTAHQNNRSALMFHDRTKKWTIFDQRPAHSLATQICRL
jgi:hypothetical protein